MARTTEQITIRIEGSAIGDFFPFERMTALLFNLEKLLKMSIELVKVEDDEPLTEFQLYAGFPERGSYIQEFQVVWNALDDVAHIAAPLAPLIPLLLTDLRDAIEFIKLYLQLPDSKSEPTISVTDNHGNVTINNGGVHHHATTIVLAGKVANPLVDIEKLLTDGIDSITFEEKNGNRLTIDKKDRDLFVRPRGKRAAKELSRIAVQLSREQRGQVLAQVDGHHQPADEPVEAVVNILSFDKIRRSGKLDVVDSETLKEGKYEFELAARPETEGAIMAMLRSHIRVSCRVLGGRKLELLRVEAVIN